MVKLTEHTFCALGSSLVKIAVKRSALSGAVKGRIRGRFRGRVLPASSGTMCEESSIEE